MGILGGFWGFLTGDLEDSYPWNHGWSPLWCYLEDVEGCWQGHPSIYPLFVIWWGFLLPAFAPSNNCSRVRFLCHGVCTQSLFHYRWYFWLRVRFLCHGVCTQSLFHDRWYFWLFRHLPHWLRHLTHNWLGQMPEALRPHPSLAWPNAGGAATSPLNQRPHLAKCRRRSVKCRRRLVKCRRRSGVNLI